MMRALAVDPPMPSGGVARRAQVVAIAGVVFVAVGARAEHFALTSQMEATLTAIDTQPSIADLAEIFNGSDQAVADLAVIASDATEGAAVQLPAISALREFPADGTVPHDTLVGIIDANATARTGSSVLLLRAAIESLGALAAAGHAEAGDTDLLVSHLGDDSRDVRASVATALGELCDTSAIASLQARFNVEPSAQVQLAISAALRVLGSCAPP